MGDEKETSFYANQNGVRITSTRAVIGAKTYSMANISSVELAVIPPSTGALYVLIIAGVLLALCVFVDGMRWLALLGGFLLLLGIALLRMAKPSYAVKIESSSGSANVITSQNKSYIEGIVTAMNEAFIKRG